MKQTAILLQVGVKVILFNEKGRFLVLKRNADKYPNTSGCWDIPGGRILPGIDLYTNLKRELKEETALELDVSSLELLAAQDILLSDRHIVRLTYKAKANGAVHLLDGEHAEYKWVSPQKAKEMDNLDKYLREVLEKC